MIGIWPCFIVFTIAFFFPFEWIHKLGNLVLLDRKKNSSLSNAQFERKKERYSKNYETRP
ncbi:MAG: HNH endonuclease family protein, partial [Cyanobacteria bacterium J06597_1]